MFNAAQTESLFKYGGIKGANPRGKALVGGTAFAGGSSGSGGGWGKVEITEVEEKKTTTTRKSSTTSTAKSTKSSTRKSKQNSKQLSQVSTLGGGSSNKSATSGSSASGGGTDKVDGSAVGTDKFEETFDWVEIAISRIEREIDNLDQRVNNVYSSWSNRNIALKSEITKVNNEIKLQKQAYDEYMSKANSVGLDGKYVSMIKNGRMDISTITDESLAEKIKEYQQWYEKALACEDAIQDLKETESALYQQRFDNISAQYDGILQGYEHTESMLNEYISQAEAQGQIVSKEYYKNLIDNEKSNIATLKKEQADLIAARDKAVADGAIVKGSQAWMDMSASIDAVTQEIEQSTTALIEYNNAMRDIDWQVFDLIQERISAVTEEADFLIELMSNKKLFDDKGNMTNEGLATMGLHAQNYNTYMHQADTFGEEAAKLKEQLDKAYDSAIEEKYRERLNAQRESILAAENEKNAIKDLISEGYDKQLESLQELIDAKNEALESEKDLYDYQKRVKEQTSEIASLQKKLSSYENDSSEEAAQKVQELKVSLKEAEDALAESEYERYISDQQKMLDTLYDEYELILNTRLDNIDVLLQNAVDAINDNVANPIVDALTGETNSISKTLSDTATSVGTKLSSEMTSIWTKGGKSVVEMYGTESSFGETTIATTLAGIKVSVDALVNKSNQGAKKKVAPNKTTTSAKKDPTKSTTTSKKNTTTTKKSSSNGDGKPKVGDKVKFVSGQYYYDSQGKRPLGSHNRGKYVYITNINDKKWATHGYHISTGKKLGNGDLGWLKLNQISGYASGKYNFLDNEVAWTQENGKEFIVRPSDGAILTPIAKGDSVLTSAASNNIWNMANSPAEFIKESLNLGDANVPNNSTVQSNYTQYLDKVVFNLPNIKSYDELLSDMQKDPKFEKLITAMTFDRLAGKSGLTKGKSIR